MEKKNLRWTQKKYRILKAAGRQGGSVGGWGGITGQGSGKLGSQISQELGFREVSSSEMTIKWEFLSDRKIQAGLEEKDFQIRNKSWNSCLDSTVIWKGTDSEMFIYNIMQIHLCIAIFQNFLASKTWNSGGYFNF